MPLYLASAAELAALPVGTRYKVYCDRPDLFGGKAVIGCESVLALAAAPSKYANGVPIADGARGEDRTVEAEKDPAPQLSDAEILKVVAFRKLTIAPAPGKELADG